MPPCPSGLDGQAARGFQQHPAGRGIDRRHRPLAEDVQVLFGQAEAIVRGEESRRSRRASPGWSSGRAESARRAAAPRRRSFRRGSERATGRRRGPMGNMPLGWSNPRRVPCPPATRITPTCPAAEGLAAARGGPRSRREAVLRTSKRNAGGGPARRPARGNSPWSCPAPDRAAGAKSRSMPADLPASDSRPWGVNPCPNASKMFLLAVGRRIAKASVASAHRTLPAHDHVRFDRLAGVFQVGAGVLHVEANGVELVARALARQSRAVEQGSTLPVIPRADFEITQVSRGRRVMRTGGSWDSFPGPLPTAACSSCAQVMMMCDAVSISNSGMENGPFSQGLCRAGTVPIFVQRKWDCPLRLPDGKSSIIPGRTPRCYGVKSARPLCFS